VTAPGRAANAAVDVTVDASGPGRGWTEHAIERAWERHGIVYKASEWRTMLLAIIDARDGRPGGAILAGIDPRAPDRLIYHVRLAGKLVRAVYDPSNATIITVLGRSRSIVPQKAGKSHQLQRHGGRTRVERRGGPPIDQWDDE